MSTEIISSANDILSAHSTLISRTRQSQKSHRRLLQNLHPLPSDELINLPLIPSPPRSPSPANSDSSPAPISPTEPRADRNKPFSRAQQDRPDLPPSKRARLARYKNYVPEEETIRNDYSQHYVDSGEWPQNFVLGAEIERRFEEYPKQHRLLTLKKSAVRTHSLSPTYLPFSSLPTLLTTPALPSCKFDVILLDPPFSSSFTWDTLQSLPIPQLAADPSFIFMWVGSGSGDGLERGRDVLGKWGYRRCEDVVWVRTNKSRRDKGPGTDPPTTSLLVRTKQHCLIGIRGTVRRSTDSWFVHCNVDTDVILWEGDSTDPTLKPPEMYTLIENFCLGTRRLELFGRATSSLRRGWVTVLNEAEEEELSALKERQQNSGGAEAESHPLDAATARDTDKPAVVTANVDVDADADLRSTPDRNIDAPSTKTIYFVPGENGGELSRFDRESWEAGIKSLANGGKAVVPLTSDIDALRPKSPFRPGASGAAGNGGTGGGSGSSSVVSGGVSVGGGFVGGGGAQGGMGVGGSGSNGGGMMNVGPRFHNAANRGGNPMMMGMGGMGGVQAFGMGGMGAMSGMGMNGMNGMHMNMGGMGGGMNGMNPMEAMMAGFAGMGGGMGPMNMNMNHMGGLGGMGGMGMGMNVNGNPNMGGGMGGMPGVHGGMMPGMQMGGGQGQYDWDGNADMGGNGNMGQNMGQWGR
ncbi:MT-A70-domain-containing protein [Marasmius fiardii PR-910]|nr:MT-A70-domain-containing protein [Marasmius fiardii PR-910]